LPLSSSLFVLSRETKSQREGQQLWRTLFEKSIDSPMKRQFNFVVLGTPSPITFVRGQHTPPPKRAIRPRPTKVEEREWDQRVRPTTLVCIDLSFQTKARETEVKKKHTHIYPMTKLMKE
jgi:hypothetical protein